jgi:hypothetical protein
MNYLSTKFNRLVRFIKSNNPIDALPKNPTNELSNDPINEASNNPIDASQKNPMNELSNNPIDASQKNPINELYNDPINELYNDPINELYNDPIDAPPKNPINELSNDPIDASPKNPKLCFGAPPDYSIDKPPDYSIDNIIMDAPPAYIQPKVFKYNCEKYKNMITDEFIKNNLCLEELDLECDKCDNYCSNFSITNVNIKKIKLWKL